MATNLSGGISATIYGTFQNAAFISTTFSGSPVLNISDSYSSSQVQWIYANQYTATATPTVINLYGSLVDPYGRTINMTTLEAVLIYNLDATNSLTLFGGTDPIVSNTFTLKASSLFMSTSPITIASGSVQNIKVDPGANTVQFQIMVLGN